MKFNALSQHNQLRSIIFLAQQHDLEQCAVYNSDDSWRAGYAPWVAMLTRFRCVSSSISPPDSKEDTRVAYSKCLRESAECARPPKSRVSSNMMGSPTKNYLHLNCLHNFMESSVSR